MSELNVISWNIFLNKTLARSERIKEQANRLGRVAATLAAFNKPLDIVGLQEVQAKNGERLARELTDSPGFWLQHNIPEFKGSKRGRNDEHVGMFGEAVSGFETIDIGDRRLAVLTRVGEIAIVNAHLRSGPINVLKRLHQMEAILERVENESYAIIMGDLNGPKFEPARAVLHGHEFSSVFEKTAQSHPVTFPTEPYATLTAGKSSIGRKIVQKYGLSIDDIYVRGLHVKDAGRLEEVAPGDENPSETRPHQASDHFPIWATMALPNPTPIDAIDI